LNFRDEGPARPAANSKHQQQGEKEGKRDRVYTSGTEEGVRARKRERERLSACEAANQSEYIA
jgi:hypothetical protein